MVDMGNFGLSRVVQDYNGIIEHKFRSKRVNDDDEHGGSIIHRLFRGSNHFSILFLSKFSPLFQRVKLAPVLSVNPFHACYA
jgi:hypothetical protein